MPEGPSILILAEQAQRFVGRVVRVAEGDSKVDLSRMVGKRVRACRTWGKHFLIEFSGFSMRVHLLMFGSYRIDERKDAPVRMRLGFDRGEINFYTCSVKYVEGDLDDAYDWSADVMSDAWSAPKARRKLLAEPERIAGDVLLDQTIFSGVGNIIRNEVLFRIGVHPLSRVGDLPAARLSALIREARNYSFDFLEWKKAFVLSRHWCVHKRSVCPKCGGPIRKTYPGRSARRSFACPNCQVHYPADASRRSQPPRGVASRQRKLL